MTTIVLSVRVKKEIVEEARRLGIDLRRVVEEAIALEIKKYKTRELKEAITRGLKAMEKVSEEEWIRTVKESRLER